MENSVGMKEEVYIWWESIHDPYERLEAVGRYLLRKNPEATFYDMFNFIREELFKGWKYDEDSDFIKKLDFDIDHGYRTTLQ